MRVNKFGKRILLRDEIVDIITDQLPHDDSIAEVIDSFLSSKDMEKMLDGILDVVELHIDYNLDSRQIVE